MMKLILLSVQDQRKLLPCACLSLSASFRQLDLPNISLISNYISSVIGCICIYIVNSPSIQFNSSQLHIPGRVNGGPNEVPNSFPHEYPVIYPTIHFNIDIIVAFILNGFTVGLDALASSGATQIYNLLSGLLSHSAYF